MRLSLALFMGFIALAPIAGAAPVLYHLNFTADLPAYTTPTSGSFLYDSVTSTLSQFIVVLQGITFDLTAAANNPPVLADGCNANNTPAAADVFTWITTGGCVAQHWAAYPAGSTEVFAFANSGQFGAINFVNSQTLSGGPSASGSFTVSQDGVPEPSTMAMALGGVGCLAWLRRKNTSRRPGPCVPCT